MSPNHSLVQDLIHWGSSHQAYLHPNVEIYQDAVTGLSFRAVNSHPAGSKVATSSYQISLSYLNAIEADGFPRRSEPFPEEFIKTLSKDDPNIIGHFFLMQQYLMKEASFWWAYIRLLPQPDQPQSLGIPIWWPREDRKFLDGTNAEPPLRKRKDLWRAEWSKGVTILQDHFANWQWYSYVLYQWAATIFGSRSFRASLTVPEGILQDPLNLDHVRRDRFSVLLPILDIGNHNGANNVDWVSDHDGLSLTIRQLVPQGDQIFNYYGNKSNSELLVAYGFTLPVIDLFNLDRDVVNLKLKPSPEALSLRRTQRCYRLPLVAEEEYTFTVQRQPLRQGGLADFGIFSGGMIDLIMCMVANKREKRYLSANPEYCPQRDADLIEGCLSRCVLQVLCVLHRKLAMEQRRIRETGIDLPEPVNSNQRLALDYRNRQYAVLSSASRKIETRLDSALNFSSFCQHTNHASSKSENEQLAYMHQHVELLSLECAFEWLNLNYLDIFNTIIKMIAEDQAEALPLDWAILVEDWDHTYWTVWIFTVWILWVRDEKEFIYRHEKLSTWLSHMNQAFDTELASNAAADDLYADASEIGTINLMTEGITRIPQITNSKLQEWLAVPSSITRLRNFASFVAQEEAFLVQYKMQGQQALVEQRVLCISKNSRTDEQLVDGAWTGFFQRATSIRDHSQSHVK